VQGGMAGPTYPPGVLLLLTAGLAAARAAAVCAPPAPSLPRVGSAGLLENGPRCLSLSPRCFVRRQKRPDGHSAAQPRGPLRGLSSRPRSLRSHLRLRGGDGDDVAGGCDADGGACAGGNDGMDAEGSEADLDAILRAVEDMKSRVPTDEAIAMSPAPPTPLEADPQTEARLRQILASFQVTSEGNAQGRKVPGHGCGDNDGDDEEDEYGAIALHDALWHPEQGCKLEPASEQLKSILPAQLVPSALSDNETRPWRRDLAGAHALQLARTWPEKCGAHVVRGIPEIDAPAPAADLKSAAEKYFVSAYYRDRLQKLLALVAHTPFVAGLAEVSSPRPAFSALALAPFGAPPPPSPLCSSVECVEEVFAPSEFRSEVLAVGRQVAYLLSLLLPMSTTARVITAISSNSYYFPGYWGGRGWGDGRGEREKRKFGGEWREGEQEGGRAGETGVVDAASGEGVGLETEAAAFLEILAARDGELVEGVAAAVRDIYIVYWN